MGHFIKPTQKAILEHLEANDVAKSPNMTKTEKKVIEKLVKAGKVQKEYKNIGMYSSIARSWYEYRLTDAASQVGKPNTKRSKHKFTTQKQAIEIIQRDGKILDGDIGVREFGILEKMVESGILENGPVDPSFSKSSEIQYTLSNNYKETEELYSITDYSEQSSI